MIFSVASIPLNVKENVGPARCYSLSRRLGYGAIIEVVPHLWTVRKFNNELLKAMLHGVQAKYRLLRSHALLPEAIAITHRLPYAQANQFHKAHLAIERVSAQIQYGAVQVLLLLLFNPLYCVFVCLTLYTVFFMFNSLYCYFYV